jgi:hypothetical protein
MNLDWKWIGFGILIMFGLSIVAGIILGLVAGGTIAPQIESGTAPEDIEISGGILAFAALLNFLAFVGGGFIVGVKSAGRTILEPAIAAALAVVIGLVVSGNLSLGNIIAGGLVPFLAALLGGWLGEKRQESKAAP